MELLTKSEILYKVKLELGVHPQFKSYSAELCCGNKLRVEIQPLLKTLIIMYFSKKFKREIEKSIFDALRKLDALNTISRIEIKFIV